MHARPVDQLLIPKRPRKANITAVCPTGAVSECSCPCKFRDRFYRHRWAWIWMQNVDAKNLEYAERNRPGQYERPAESAAEESQGPQQNLQPWFEVGSASEFLVNFGPNRNCRTWKPNVQCEKHPEGADAKACINNIYKHITVKAAIGHLCVLTACLGGICAAC
ncbi:hypothetical protein B0H19DRAFT_1069392 [Mycena capillaripes]|nr:hypothetical protein B0H19DRAFT_1069392 [Mycena capillaripes]